MVGRLSLNQTFISVMTIGELQKGISLLPESRKRARLGSWLNGFEQQFSDSILPVDAETSHIWGHITARAQQSGVQLGTGDGLIAATAIQHGITVMTRNIRHFEPTGVLIVNPWDEGDS